MPTTSSIFASFALSVRTVAVRKRRPKCLKGILIILIHTYNFAIFPSLASNSFNWLVVTPGFLSGSAWDIDKTLHNLEYRAENGFNASNWLFQSPAHQYPKNDAIASMQVAAMNGSLYTKIGTLACLKQYNTVFGNRSDLLLVSQGYSNSSVLVGGSMGIVQGGTQDYWCHDSNTFDCKKFLAGGYVKTGEEKVIAEWNIGGCRIDYCLASYWPLHNSCTLVFSYRIMIGELQRLPQAIYLTR